MVSLRDQLIRDEGIRLRPYKDTAGKLTIGVGRNLDDVGISNAEAFYLLDNDIAKAQQNLRARLPWLASLDYSRQCVLFNMCFNLGVDKLMEFHNTLDAIADGRYGDAADDILESKWATQVGPRAQRLANQMRTGDME